MQTVTNAVGSVGLDLQQDAYRFQRPAFPPRQLINLGWKTSIFLFHFFLLFKIFL